VYEGDRLGGNKMEEKEIKGIIKFWTKEIKEAESDSGIVFSAGINIDNNWYNVRAATKGAIESLIEAAPRGSTIQFTAFSKSGNFWIVKPGTISVIYKADKFEKKGSFGFRETKKEYYIKMAGEQLISVLNASSTKVSNDRALEWFNISLPLQIKILEGLNEK
jgi:hypothetical protein